MPAQEVVPLSLGDLFDRTFRLLTQSLTRSLPIALIALVPPGLLLMAGLDAFYSMLGDFFQSTMAGTARSEETIGEILWTLALTCLGGFALLAGTVLARIGVLSITCGEMLDQRLTWQEALSRAAGFRFSRAMGQVLLEYLAIGTIIGGGYFLLIGSLIAKSALLAIVGFLVFLAAACLAVFLAVRWSQTYAVIAWEGTGPLAAFGRSSLLVQTGWWRVLGILTLFGLLKEFAIGLVTTPISLFAMWDFYQGYFSLLGSPDLTPASPALMADMLSSMGFGIGLTLLCSIVLTAVIVPAYSAALYVDLRARNGEFAAPSSTPFPPPTIDFPDDIRFDDPGADFR